MKKIMNKTNKKELKKQAGFTLIEILVVIGMIAILATIVIIAINPARQFAQGRNTQRTSNVNAILNAIGQRMADNKGLFIDPSDTTSVCYTAGEDLPVSAGVENLSLAGKNIRACLVPTYITELPVDPTDGINKCTNDACSGSGDTYDTKYTVERDANGRVKVCAPNGVEGALPGSAAICVTR